MTDQIDQSGDTTGASDQPAGSASPDLEAIVTKVAAALGQSIDQRFQGFQSTIDKKLGTFQRELQAASLSPEEREQFDAQTSEEKMAELQRKVDLYEQRDRYPRGADLLAKLFEADSLDAQLALIESSLGSEAAAQVAETVAAQADGNVTPVPEVDRNNPGRPIQAGAQSALTSDEMNDAAADAILASAGKGALVQSRKANQG